MLEDFLNLKIFRIVLFHLDVRNCKQINKYIQFISNWDKCYFSIQVINKLFNVYNINYAIDNALYHIE